jgi:hypothetical protein
MMHELANVCRENGSQVIHTGHQKRADNSNADGFGEILPELKTPDLIYTRVSMNQTLIQIDSNFP